VKQEARGRAAERAHAAGNFALEMARQRAELAPIEAPRRMGRRKPSWLVAKERGAAFAIDRRAGASELSAIQAARPLRPPGR
jgi:hypothetical protein